MGKRRTVRVYGLEYAPGQPVVPGDEPRFMKLPKYKPPKPQKMKRRK